MRAEDGTRARDAVVAADGLDERPDDGLFGPGKEALTACKQIHDVHRAIKGVDAVTGQPYDARDPDLLRGWPTGPPAG